jgi:outer membrane protein insertion porin family
LPAASISIREAAGTSVKSSLSHAFVYDTRDDGIAATKGVYGKLYHELAGLVLGGDASFYKAEFEGQASRKMWETGVVSVASLWMLLFHIF